MIEAMTSGGFRRRGALLAPADAFDDEHVVLPYTLRFVERVERLTASSGPYPIGDVELFTSLQHVHAVQTYGLHFVYDGLRVSYLPCGRYFEALAADYAAHRPDVLVVNVLRFSDQINADHFTWQDARRVVAEVRPKVAVFAHFGTKMLEADPPRLAEQLEDELGLRVIAASDDYVLDIETEVAAAP
jgi:L-ascorbate metabolism protein UlaG (beta-lactamase superfamily)